MSDAYQLGEDAALRGDDVDMNPYDERDAQHDEWEDGYARAMIWDPVLPSGH
jgi:hypothetical protein